MATPTLEKALEQQDWLEPVDTALTAVAGMAFPKSSWLQKVRNFLHGAWLGHPLHAALLDDWTVPPVSFGDPGLGPQDLGPVQKLAAETTALALADAGLLNVAGSTRTGLIVASVTPSVCDLVRGEFGFAARPYPPAAYSSSLHAVIAAAGALLSIWTVPSLNALRVGDVRARTVGVDVDRAQWTILASSSLLAASSVVLAGLVGFIGLIVPHIARRLVGSDARALLPACGAIGAALCMLADAVCRWIVAPAELPIGVLLAFIGVPAFLYLYLHGERAR